MVMTKGTLEALLGNIPEENALREAQNTINFYQSIIQKLEEPTAQMFSMYIDPTNANAEEILKGFQAYSGVLKEYVMGAEERVQIDPYLAPLVQKGAIKTSKEFPKALTGYSVWLRYERDRSAVLAGLLEKQAKDEAAKSVLSQSMSEKRGNFSNLYKELYSGLTSIKDEWK